MLSATRGGRASTRGRQPGERLPGKIEPVGEQAESLLPLGRVLGLGHDLPHPNEAFLAIGGTIELEPHAVEEIALRSGQAVLEAVRRVGRILSLRERDDLHLEPLGRGELHPAQGCLLTRRVRVEAQVDLPRQAPELA